MARDLTGPEVMDRVHSGDDIAILPVGSMEMHGPQLPLGTDTVVAEAVCRMAAPAMHGTVFDTISYTWPGGTKYSVPTVSMTMDMETRYTRMVCDQLLRCGFHRIYLVQLHGPGIPLMRLAREFFEETAVPLAFFGLLRMPDNGRKECEQAGAAWEASMCAAAAKFLGETMSIRPEAWNPPNQPPIPGLEALIEVQATGATVGSLATHASHHGTFRGRVDVEQGMATLKRIADTIARTAAPMAQWRDAWAGKDPTQSYSEG